MGVRFLHTADWQIGMKAAHVSQVADAVRKARLKTAERIMALAAEHEVHFVLIAGDMFEDNAVGNDLVHRVLRILEEAAPIPVFILPGNHDVLRPGSVYERPAFRNPPDNVHLLRTTEPVVLLDGEAALFPAPLTQKNSEVDPTDHLAELDVPIRIGVAHGSPRIEGLYQPDDHPIALDAADRHRLDYLALGHWHSWFEVDPRTIMPGTPEPTKFGEESGLVALVSLNGPRETPRVERQRVNTLEWVQKEFEIDLAPEALRQEVEAWVTGLRDPQNSLVRLTFTGPATAGVEQLLEELGDWVEARTLYSHVDASRTTPSLSRGRLRELASQHPFLAGLLADLSQLAVMAEPTAIPGTTFDQSPPDSASEVAATGETDRDGAEGKPSYESPDPALAEPLSAGELRELLAGLDVHMEPDVIREAIRQLAHRAGEVWE